MRIFVYICALLSLTAVALGTEKQIYYHISLNNHIKQIVHNVSSDILFFENRVIPIASQFHANVSSLIASYGYEKSEAFRKKYEAKGDEIADNPNLKGDCEKYVEDLLQDNVEYQAEFKGYIGTAVESWTRGLTDLQKKFYTIKKSLRDLEKAGHDCSILFDKNDWTLPYNCVIQAFTRVTKIASDADEEIPKNVNSLAGSVTTILYKLHESINKSPIPAFYAEQGEAEMLEMSCSSRR